MDHKQGTSIEWPLPSLRGKHGNNMAMTKVEETRGLETMYSTKP